MLACGFACIMILSQNLLASFGPELPKHIQYTFGLIPGLYNGECRPFIVDGLQVGVIRPDVLKELFKFPEVFVIKDNEKSKVVELNPAFRDYNERTEHVDRILRQFRKENVFLALKGWRDEVRTIKNYIKFVNSIVIDCSTFQFTVL